MADFLREKGRKLPTTEACAFDAHDKILLPEYFWNNSVTAAAAKRVTFGGAKIYRIIYDVIPVALPKLFAGSWVRKFRRYVNEAINNCDIVLTISDFSKADILKHFQNVCAGKPIVVLKLPHEFIGTEDQKDSLLRLSTNCSCNYVPGLWQLADMGDIGALLAPRPLLVETGRDDRLNGERGVLNVTEQRDITRQAYALLGVEDRLAHAVFSGGHRWDGAAVLPWLARWL